MAVGTRGSLLGLFGRRPCPLPAPSDTGARPPTQTGVAPEAGGSTLALSLPSAAHSRGGALELLGPLWHRAGTQLSLLYMSPSAFKIMVLRLAYM